MSEPVKIYRSYDIWEAVNKNPACDCVGLVSLSDHERLLQQAREEGDEWARTSANYAEALDNVRDSLGLDSTHWMVIHNEVNAALKKAREEATKAERERWANGIEYHLGTGQISCEEVWSVGGDYIGIQLRKIEQQPIGSSTNDVIIPDPDAPSVVICVHKVESAIVLLELVTKVCRFLTDCRVREAVKKAQTAAIEAKQKEAPSE